MRARGLLCWLWLVLLLLSPRRLEAESIARVVIVRPAGGDTLLNEALIRTRGELRAVGLTVEIQLVEEGAPRPEESVYGTLIFKRSEGRIEIEALAPGVDQPVVQVIDSQHPAVDAEVVAVRAVEALRAAMLQYAKRARAAEQELPEAVVGFTKIDKPDTETSETTGRAERPAPQLEPEPLPGPEPAPSAASRAPAEPIRWSLWLGPELTLDVGPSLPSIGGRIAGFAAWQWLAFGVSLEHSFGARALESSEGRASVQRTGALGHAKLAIRLSSSVTPFVHVGFGARRYRARGSAEPGYGDRVATHWSALASIDFGSTYRLLTNLGAYLSMGARLATDAPDVTFAERSVATLEQPSVAVAGGLILGAL